MTPGLWALILAGFIIGFTLATSFGFHFLTFKTFPLNPAGSCHVWIRLYSLVLLSVLREQSRDLKKPFWRSNSRAQGLEHIELDSNKPLQRLRVFLKFIESVLPHHCLGSPWWFRLPMVSLYTLWLTTQIELWGRRASFQPNNSLELENLWLMKIKGYIHTHVCGYALPLNVEKRNMSVKKNYTLQTYDRRLLALQRG